MIAYLLGGLVFSSVFQQWIANRIDDFDLQVHDFGITGRGLRTLRSRAAGEELLRVSMEDAVTLTTLMDKYPMELTVLVENMNEGKVSEEMVIALGLFLLKRDGNIYVSNLPKYQYSVLNMPDPLLQLLPFTYQKIVSAYRELTQTLYSSFPKNVLSTFSIDDFYWAYATTRSRCVEVSLGDIGDRKLRALLPVFDLLNHKFGASSFLDYSAEEESFVITSMDSYAEGEQIFISYGSSRDNLQLFTTYGFCVQNNPSNVIFFDFEELLQACTSVRPTFFTEQVKEQLLDIMKKVGSIRELYEFDGSTGHPRKSLEVGISMVGDIEKQFLLEPDATFSIDVLNSLISKRLQENRFKLEVLNEKILYVDPEWKPLGNSLRVLLKEELQCLTSFLEGTIHESLCN
jgi:SET domain